MSVGTTRTTDARQPSDALGGRVARASSTDPLVGRNRQYQR
ncbi:hypothetical protein HSB1_36140 [Halogranum salarium B-1]|uniref:Uncharacterized protein n=1 Tax=Halogranum salarium B-1 TaxID=1210908 RepID=J3EUT5_9EURY|nr:hypothetical protein HSB1_36140 [Halogranum salarium B-1]